MDKDRRDLLIASTAVGGVMLGPYVDSCLGVECMAPAPYQPVCSVDESSISCTADSLSTTVAEIFQPATEYPDGAVVGAFSGLVCGMVLCVLADRLRA